jgi:hypothetical protein
MRTMSCEAPITEKAANDLYQRLAAVQAADRCELDEVETNKTQMLVTWKQNDRALLSAEVVRAECAQADAVAGPTFAIRVPAELRAACPTSVSAAVGIIQKQSFDVPAHGAPVSQFPIVPIAIAVAVLVVVFNVAMVLRHR